MSRFRNEICICVLLTLLTLLAYRNCLQNGFVNFDDDRYVTQNPAVQQGLTWAGVRYALTTFETGNWIPLTWLSLELDATIGKSAAVYHGTNVLLHLANVLLFFFVLRRFQMSAVVAGTIAGLFAVHPLHVESVAWISERKDVLSTFLLLISLLLYQSFQSRPRNATFVCVVLTFTLGLMAKPMLVTFPALLLVLDLWVFGRTGGDTAVTFKHLAWEKWPLWLISLTFGVLTIVAQRSESTLASMYSLSAFERFTNAVQGLDWYVAKTFVPTNLCIFVPLRTAESGWHPLIGSILLVGAVSSLCFWQQRSRPWLLAGWLWFVVALLPVIGIVQVGAQACADRYTYLPQMGLLVLVVTVAGEVFSRLRIPAGVLAWGAIPVIVGFAFLCDRQVQTWKDSRTLWNHALTVIPGNWMAHYQLGREALFASELAQARAYAVGAIDSAPQAAVPYALLARIDQAEGAWMDAERNYQRTLQLQPDNRDALLGMAAVAYSRGNIEVSLRILRDRTESHPRDLYARLQLGLIYAATHQPELALIEFDNVLTIDPTHLEVCKHAGRMLLRDGESTRAAAYYELAAAIAPDDAECQDALSRLR